MRRLYFIQDSRGIFHADELPKFIARHVTCCIPYPRLLHRRWPREISGRTGAAGFNFYFFIPHPCHQRSSRSRFEEADDPSEHDNHPVRDCQTEVVHGRRQIQLENKGGVWPLPGSFCPPPRRSKMRGYAENFIFVAPDFRARCSWVVGRERDSDNESGVCCCSRGTTGLAREQWREQQQEPPCWQRPWPSSDCSRGRGHCLRRFRSRSRSTGWRRERMP